MAAPPPPGVVGLDGIVNSAPGTSKSFDEGNATVFGSQSFETLPVAPVPLGNEGEAPMVGCGAKWTPGPLGDENEDSSDVPDEPYVRPGDEAWS